MNHKLDILAPLAFGFLTGFVSTIFLLASFPNSLTDDVKLKVHKEAFELGFMMKEITKDDRVIYKWKDIKNESTK